MTGQNSIIFNNSKLLFQYNSKSSLDFYLLNFEFGKRQLKFMYIQYKVKRLVKERMENKEIKHCSHPTVMDFCSLGYVQITAPHEVSLSNTESREDDIFWKTMLENQKN